MSDVILRKKISCIEEILHEGGPAPDVPLRRASVLAVIKNPFAGRYEPDIQWFMEPLKPLGLEMAQMLIDMLGGADQVSGYGKGAIIGAAGEVEHGALWHAPGGYAMRQLLSDSKAIVPSTKKVGGVGTILDIPITHTNASYVRGHFDAMEVGCTGGRIHDRAGGLAAADVIGQDGLR
jgi:hypothetical protein